MPRIDSKRNSGRRIESIRSNAGAASLVRARWTLLSVFLLNGVLVSSWLARIPSVRDALSMSTAELGAVLLAGAVGALASLTVAGALVTRFGGYTASVVSTLFFGFSYVLLGLGPATGSVALLAAGIFLNGVAFAVGNITLNVESAGIERRMGRTVLPHFHAAYSIGAVLGSLVGAACAGTGVPVLVQFGATAVVAIAWRLATIPFFIHDTRPAPRAAGVVGSAVGGDAAAAGRDAADVAGPPADPTSGGPSASDTARFAPTVSPRRVPTRVRLGAALGAWREPRTLFIGLVVLSAAFSEGSANDWLSLAVVDGFAQTEAVGAVVFGAFVAAMTVMRLAGTRLLDRFGRVAVLRASGIVSIGGLLLFGLAPTLPLAAFGVVAWGLGAALAVPIGIAAASDEPLRAAGRVSVVSAFASTASLAAPPLLGIAAGAVGARHALTFIAVVVVLSVALARHVAPARGARQSARAAGPAAPEGAVPEGALAVVGAPEGVAPDGAPAQVHPSVGVPAAADLRRRERLRTVLRHRHGVSREWARRARSVVRGGTSWASRDHAHDGRDDRTHVIGGHDGRDIDALPRDHEEASA